jgi:hypothetical protein
MNARIRSAMNERTGMTRSISGRMVEQTLNRRRLLRLIAGGIVSLSVGVTAPVPGRAEETTDDDMTFDTCYWQSYQTVCSGGRKKQYRCEICCAGGVCETVQCLWVDVGSC